MEADIYDEDYRGLIHLQIALLSNYVNQCIKEGLLKEVGRVFIFFERMIARVNPYLYNALYVSFLEHVEMEGDSENAINARKLLNSQYLATWCALREVKQPVQPAVKGKKKGKT